MLVEFTTDKARDVVLRKKKLLEYFYLHYIRIFRDVPIPLKHWVTRILKTNNQCFVMLESQPMVFIRNTLAIYWSDTPPSLLDQVISQYNSDIIDMVLLQILHKRDQLVI